MGILFSLAYPGFTAHYDMINLSGSADKMHSHTNWAKNTAIVREKNAIFRIWAAGDEFPNEYQFAVIDEGDGGLGDSVVPPGETSSGSERTAIGNNVQIDIRNCETSNPCVLTYTFSRANYATLAINGRPRSCHRGRNSWSTSIKLQYLSPLRKQTHV